MISELVKLVIGLPIFLILCFFVFYFPGRIVLSNKAKKLTVFEKTTLSFVFGFIVFVLLAVVLGLLSIRYLSLSLYIFLFLYSLPRYLSEPISFFKSFFADRKLLLLIVFGIIFLGLINFPSGLKYEQGVMFWSSQGHDGLWHVSLMEEIKNHFPPTNPLYPGHPIINYHYASDILMGEFYRLFPFFNSLDLYFRYYPVLFAFLIGLSCFSFASKQWSKAVGYWSVFFAYFCGSFGYLYLAIKGRFVLGGETTFWASQNNTILGNPPHTLGIILLTSFLICLRLFFKSKNRAWLFFAFLLTFFLSIFKVSAGAVLIAGLTGTTIFYTIREKKFDLSVFSLMLAGTNFGLLKLISPTAESFLHFEPLWFSRTMMVARLDNVDWELRRQHYLSLGTWKAWLRIIQLEATALLIFVVGNTGIRLVGFFTAIKSFFKKKANYIDIFLLSGLGAAFLVPIFFVQKGITYNLIQFMQIYFHFLGFFAAVFVVQALSFFKNKYQKTIFSLLIILLAVPSAIGSLFDFYGPGHYPLAIVSNSELEALSWLEKNSPKETIVLTVPFNGSAKYRYSSLPLPISAWYSTPYQYVFSGRYGFLTGEEQLEITGYDYKPDLKKAKQYFSEPGSRAGLEFLKGNNISYIYLRKDEVENLPNLVNMSAVFENEETIIYKVNK